jgi:GTPase
MKSAFVAIVGRPSSGKSTLLNRICGNKVAIVSAVPQTTRNKIRGIFNSEGHTCQLVFIDTPGYHMSDKSFNKQLASVVLSAIDECDMVLYISDVTRQIGDEERAVLDIVSHCGKPTAVALNKIDARKNMADQIESVILAAMPGANMYRISALKGDGVDGLLAKLEELAPVGDMMYPEEFYSDQPPDFRIAEIIREKAINNTREEVPHSLYVEIEDMEMMGEGEDQAVWVRGFIYVERESQKGILVGKNGDLIKKILREAQEDIDPLFPYRIDLDIRVKVKPHWKNDEKLVRRILDQ